ncbi:NAD(P)/FAD-dependent oxidoreductase [Mucilaginibacter daejeonensis]|uniref:NAD(P)/FAD-dependent oxidoreductase n=1 Tax=Mucilaginibacter daejeonensis TaxID=398049 RepID=UPI001D173232|nr:NAD(P)/FAD-dependent oxidoreductase [Mucilaginibacter daejeonensis]UEG55264.1 NAD(P)/FAD-dependent oxidoreductase [Mucilaginibacter daejeonensis]
MTNNATYDVIVVGGSNAGLQAAMTLARALRKVLVIDSGKPCNRSTPHSHNFLTRDGATPQEILIIGREQLLLYPTVTLLNATVTKADGVDHKFTVHTDDGGIYHAKKLLFATGINDQLPDIPGFKDCWGITAIHCPYCHGYEVKQQPTGILSKGNDAYDLAKLISNWTDQLTVFSNGPLELEADKIELLHRKNISIVTENVSELIHNKGHLSELICANGDTYRINAIYSRSPFSQHCELPEHFGCQLTETGLIQVDQFGKTSVDGIYAAGDNSSPLRSVANAVAMGAVSAAFINRELIGEEF